MSARRVQVPSVDGWTCRVCVGQKKMNECKRARSSPWAEALPLRRGISGQPLRAPLCAATCVGSIPQPMPGPDPLAEVPGDPRYVVRC